MRYCRKCVQPDTRPGIYFSEEGICGACLYQEEVKNTIDWEKRENEIREIADEAKKQRTGPYDCAIGVSGGKDSTFQALYARDKLDLKPLLVNSEPENITETGSHNIENLKQLGFDIISLRPNPQVMKKLVKKDFYRYLNPVKVTEYSLWASTYIIAQHFDIKLIIQGENPGLTLGVRETTGTDDNALKADKQNTIVKNYLEEYSGDGIDVRDLFMFHYDSRKLEKRGVRAIWLNYYASQWSQPGNAAFSMRHGLRIRPKDMDLHDIGTYRRFSQLDSELTQVNQMLKYIKFGFGQATDHACSDIREGNISREEGILLVKEFDGKCADRYIKQFCDYIEISADEFWKVTNSFRGDIWERDEEDCWRLKAPLWGQESIDFSLGVNHIIKRIEL